VLYSGTQLAFGVVCTLQVLGTIAKRNHYTVDILLGIFVAYYIDKQFRNCYVQTVSRGPTKFRGAQFNLKLYDALK